MDANITYERSIYKSYMKIPAVETECLDEKILLTKQIDGLLPMEKAFLNEEGQYWYDISGKQALDQYCKTNKVDIVLFEQLILRICNQLEGFEWNLLKEECLLLRPELIFISTADKRIYFTGYPSVKGNVLEAFRNFMDYILTKIDHSDVDAVQRAYEIYEMLLQEEIQLFDLKKRILDGRTQRLRDIQVIEEENLVLSEKSMECEGKEINVIPEKHFEWSVHVFWKKWIERLKGILSKKDIEDVAKDKEIQDVVYPDETENRTIRPVTHPTICLMAENGNPRGVLVYEGTELFLDFEIEKELCLVGKNWQVDLMIDKNTISQYHAKIEQKDSNYYIEDMNSTNGTFVNEEILNYKESRLLCVGDAIRFADVKYRFW